MVQLHLHPPLSTPSTWFLGAPTPTPLHTQFNKCDVTAVCACTHTCLGTCVEDEWRDKVEREKEYSNRESGEDVGTGQDSHVVALAILSDLLYTATRPLMTSDRSAGSTSTCSKQLQQNRKKLNTPFAFPSSRHPPAPRTALLRAFHYILSCRHNGLALSLA